MGCLWGRELTPALRHIHMETVLLVQGNSMMYCGLVDFDCFHQSSNVREGWWGSKTNKNQGRSKFMSFVPSLCDCRCVFSKILKHTGRDLHFTYTSAFTLKEK